MSKLTINRLYKRVGWSCSFPLTNSNTAIFNCAEINEKNKFQVKINFQTNSLSGFNYRIEKQRIVRILSLMVNFGDICMEQCYHGKKELNYNGN